MHEVSLMRNLLAVVERAADGEGARPVRSIHLRIGEMAGVSADALLFAFDVLSRGTVAEGGTLEYEIVPLAARCRTCGAGFCPAEYSFACPSCGSGDTEITAGREMEIDYICVDDGPDS
jgi:hydrogenase nickel incorporation protein HypA/HybF